MASWLSLPSCSTADRMASRDAPNEFTPWISEIQVPGSASNLLEYRMAQNGHEVVGFTVHVPHYLTQTDYPAAAQALLEQVGKTGAAGLFIPRSDVIPEIHGDDGTRSILVDEDVESVVERVLGKGEIQCRKLPQVSIWLP